jgi:allantoinase
MFDLLIENGTIVTAQGSYPGALAIKGGLIAAMGQIEASQAQEVLDARGLHILPGLIDDHVHFREPGLAYKEDFESGSRAAAIGGVTTICDMPNTKPPLTTVDEFRNKLALIRGRSFVDFGLYAALVADNTSQLIPLADEGAIGYKLYMGETTGYIRCPDDGILFESFKNACQAGLRVGAHAENDWILQHEKTRLINQGRTDPRAHLDSRPAFAELEAISRALILSEAAGNKFHVFHLSTRQGLERIREARSNGLPVTCEVLVGHLLFNDEAYERLGNLIKLNPPIRTREHQEALWEGLRRGWIDMLATDHAPHSFEEKTEANVWKAAGGFIGVETALSLMLTEVNKGKLSLERYVQASAENPARAWGLYPRKGSIQIGSDADLVLVDLKKQAVISADRLHNKNRLTPYEGWQVQGVPVYTFLRGQKIVQDGEIVGQPCGELVKPQR